MQRIVPNLWFDDNGLEAAEYYTSVFPQSKILQVTRYGEAGPLPAGTVLTIEFELRGERFTIINGGPQGFQFSEAVSFLINCADQDEVDYFWSEFEKEGEPGPCGWIKDKFGLSWQVCPIGFEEIMNDPDPARRDRAMTAMFSMGKLDLAALQRAADGA